MKISICIPVYNFDINELVFALQSEISYSNLSAEILLIDDASSIAFREQTTQAFQLAQNTIVLNENKGRSGARNLFLNIAKGDYLLFLDCDVKIMNKNFIENYISVITNKPEIDLFYGGFTVDEEYNNLRNFYSRKREISTNFGSKDFNTFKTANFLIKKEVFKKFPFNEKMKQYGYEDYLFAKVLEENRINYLYTNNPVMHMDYSESQDFLNKIDLAMDSLYQLSKDAFYCEKIKDIKIYKASQLLSDFRMEFVFLKAFRLIEKSIRKNLLSESPNIFLFDLYKLGKYTKINLENKKISETF